MSDAWHNILGLLLTIISGIAIYILGRLIYKFMIEPAYELRAILREVAIAMEYYGYVYGNPGTCKEELMEEASKRLRNLGCSLGAKAEEVPLHNQFHITRLFPKYEDIMQISKDLIAISNCIYVPSPEFVQSFIEKNDERRDRILKILHR
jgi:hypothetical protein